MSTKDVIRVHVSLTVTSIIPGNIQLDINISIVTSKSSTKYKSHAISSANMFKPLFKNREH
jgi:hypothetical protein